MRTRLLDAAARLARRAIRRDSSLGDRLRRLRHTVAREPVTRPIEQVVDAFARSHPRASFVQIGSNDGVRFDPICRQVRTRPWTGVMVEPVPYLFDRLRAHFGGNRRVQLENAAISDHDGTGTFYHLAESTGGEADLPDWYDALGSFRRDVVLSHRTWIPDIDRRLREVEVPCLTFESLCQKHGVERIDLVHVDTEGYDYEIIKLIDLDRWGPAVLLFEHKHLSPDDRSDCNQRLETAGYELVSDDEDTLAIKASTIAADASLAAAWHDATAQSSG